MRALIAIAAVGVALASTTTAGAATDGVGRFVKVETSGRAHDVVRPSAIGRWGGIGRFGVGLKAAGRWGG